MLTGDLVRARRRGAALVPQYINAATRDRIRPLAEQLIAVHRAMVGESRERLEQALAGIRFEARDRVIGLGLCKLLEDRSTYAIAEGVVPEDLRHEVFLAAAAAHRELDVRDAFDRDEVLRAVAERMGKSVDEVEGGLYADLRSAELLRAFEAVSGEDLLDLYDVSLVRALLLRATKVTVTLSDQTSRTYRDIFRAARFHGLLHTVTGTEDTGYAITVDGPFSLFDAVQRYGMRLGMFLPHVLACSKFQLEADLVWGKSREHLTLSVGSSDRLRAKREDDGSLSPELEALVASFRKLDSGWEVKRSDRIFSLPGHLVCAPDLLFHHRESGAKAYLEAFGFWSRDAVWRRVELVRAGLSEHLILAVGKQLRVSEAVLDEGSAGELYVYKTTMSARAILERLDKRRSMAT